MSIQVICTPYGAAATERLGEEIAAFKDVLRNYTDYDTYYQPDRRSLPFEEFDLAMRQELPKLMIERMAGNAEIVKRCLNDPDFQAIVFAGLARGIYETVTAQ